MRFATGCADEALESGSSKGLVRAWALEARFSRRLAMLLGLVSLVAFAPPAHAADDVERKPEMSAESREPATPDLRLHLVLTGVGVVTLVSAVALSPTLAPSNCRWCDRNRDGTDSLNSFDRSVRADLKWKDTKTADTMSTVFSFGLAPLAGVGIGALIAAHDSRLSELPVDLLVVGESAVLATNINEFSKFAFARERPNVHFRSPSERAAQRSSSDNLSFFSGHATLAFALATSAGTVASLRRHRLAPIMWTVGMLFATTGAYLRIAADQHYATDVITGAAVGSAVGFAVPYFFHRTSGARLTLLPSPGGITAAGVW